MPTAVSRWHVTWSSVLSATPKKTHSVRHSENFQHKSAVRRFPKRELIQELCTKKDVPVRTEEPMIMILCCLKNRDLGKTSSKIATLMRSAFVFLLRPFQKEQLVKVKMQSPAHHPGSPMGQQLSDTKSTEVSASNKLVNDTWKPSRSFKQISNIQYLSNIYPICIYIY